MKRLSPTVEGALWLFLGIEVSTALLILFVPNSALSVHVYCDSVFREFNSTKWYNGEYSPQKQMEIQDCYRRIGSQIR